MIDITEKRVWDGQSGRKRRLYDIKIMENKEGNGECEEQRTEWQDGKQRL